MPSETDFLNEALGKFGAARIVSIDDGTTNANHCQTHYASTRRAALRVYDWKFAESRAQLAASLTPPLFEYAYAYALPANYIKLRTYYGGGTTSDAGTFASLYAGDRFNQPLPYKTEGAYLFSNDSTALILFTQDITDPNKWDALFYNMLVPWLASKLAAAITKDINLAKSFLEEAMVFGLPMAAVIDSQEQSTQPYISDDLTWGR